MTSDGPGPVYLLPPTIGYQNHDQRKVRMPQYSFGERTQLTNKNIIPGPGLNVSGLTRYGPARKAAYTIGPRIFLKDSRNVGPGPARYNLNMSPDMSSPRPPAYSIGSRIAIANKNINPGPNVYGIKDNISKPSAPAFSIGMRTSFKSKVGSPGPANYNISSTKTYLPKAPEYSLTSRTMMLVKPFGPGANAYNRMSYKPGKNTPSYSFGTRHSPRAPPMIVACDNM